MSTSMLAVVLVTIGQVHGQQYLPTNLGSQDLLNFLTGKSSDTRPSSNYPMGNVLLPMPFGAQAQGAQFGAQAAAQGGAQLLGETILQGQGQIEDDNNAAPDLSRGFTEPARFDPTYRWTEYKKSFIAEAGVPEKAHTHIVREMLAIDKWFYQIVNSPLVNAFQLTDYGTFAPRWNTFASPGNPSKPIMPCPPGTPQFVCNQVANSVSNNFAPQPFDFDSQAVTDQNTYMFYQMLAGRGYMGPGAIYPQAPMFTNAPSSIGPAPTPWASAQDLVCPVEMFIYIPFNVPQQNVVGLNRANEMEFSYLFGCACGAQNEPIMDQCRLDPKSFDEEFPAQMLPYPLMWYDAAFLADTNAVPSSFDPCGDYDNYRVAQKCKTVVVPGLTPPPPLRPAGPQASQPQFDVYGGMADPFQCGVAIEYQIYFDSPMAWENHYNTYSWLQYNQMMCHCDQFNNPILSLCRQDVVDDWPIPTNVGPDPSLFPLAGRSMGPGPMPQVPTNVGPTDPSLAGRSMGPGPMRPNGRRRLVEAAKAQKSSAKVASYENMMAESISAAEEAKKTMAASIANAEEARRLYEVAESLAQQAQAL